VVGKRKILYFNLQRPIEKKFLRKEGRMFEMF